MSDTTIKVQVFGRVQSVGFRYFTQMQAMQLGLKGRASNLYDGSVEVLAQGRSESIDALLDWLKQGPRLASVQSIDVLPLSSGDIAELKEQADYEFRAY